MAAGGFKTFTTGEVLTAADTNNFLMQGVLVFDDAAARDAAITAPVEGQVVYLKDTNAVLSYDGSSYVAVGGSSSPLTTKGDLYTFSTVDARLGVGANGTVLTAASGEATGLQWAAPAGSSFSGVSVYNSATQVIADSTFTVLTFDSEEFDTDSYHSTITNTGRITCTSEGKYLFNAQATFPIGTTGRLLMRFRKNGTTTVETGSFDYAFGASGDDSVSISKILDVEANDYFEFLVYQTTGGDLDCFSGLATTWFQAAYLGA